MFSFSEDRAGSPLYPLVPVASGRGGYRFDPG